MAKGKLHRFKNYILGRQIPDDPSAMPIPEKKALTVFIGVGLFLFFLFIAFLAAILMSLGVD